MKKIFWSAAFLFAATFLGGCSDFFEVGPDNTLDDQDYISEESEIYTGFMGVLSKLQAVGDKPIYLFELRGEMIQPTSTAPRDLWQLYNYDDDLTGNSYANPAGFYEVINACNDYLSKLKKYKESHAIKNEYYQGLVGSTLRVKAWTFMTIAKLYGEVVWVDKPMTSLRDLSKFKTLPIDKAMASCKNLLDFGYDDVDGTHTTDWVEWTQVPDDDVATSEQRYWDDMVPSYCALYGELCLWLGKYQKCIDVIQSEMNTLYMGSNAQSIKWLRSQNMASKWNTFWNHSAYPYPYESVGTILYNYEYDQTNELWKHFDSDAPNKYWLMPCEAGMARFSDTSFTPLGIKEIDFRAGATFNENHNGKAVFCKYRSTSSSQPAYRNDVPVYMYRGADLYLMLAEAFNELGKRKPVDALINTGIDPANFDCDENEVYSGTWEGFVPHWTNAKCMYTNKKEATNRTYGDIGLRMTSANSMGARTFTNDIAANREELLKEIILEESGEGKAYPAMIRMAMRTGDWSFMANVVGEKYQGNATVKSKILNGDVFIHYDLGTDNKE